MALLRLVLFLVGNFKDLAGLFSSFSGAVAAAAAAKSSTIVEQGILKGLKKAIVLVFKLVIRIFRLGSLVTTVREWLGKLRRKITDLFQRFLTWLKIWSGIAASKGKGAKKTTAWLSGVPRKTAGGKPAACLCRTAPNHPDLAVGFRH